MQFQDVNIHFAQDVHTVVMHTVQQKTAHVVIQVMSPDMIYLDSVQMAATVVQVVEWNISTATIHSVDGVEKDQPTMQVHVYVQVVLGIVMIIHVQHVVLFRLLQARKEPITVHPIQEPYLDYLLIQAVDA